MSRTARWDVKDIKDGVMEVELASWKYFHDYIRQEMLEFSHYVWRGQRDSDWPLHSSLERRLAGSTTDKARATQWHVYKFKQSTRGRRGPNPTRIENENEWWALGQHHGLATPLLDWTESPFVALYFAFDKPLRPASGFRSVWALGSVATKNKEIIDADKAAKPVPTTPPGTLDFVRPVLDENARLVAQAGLFTRAPVGQSVDSWVQTAFKGETAGATLIKIRVPEIGRTECLRTLNRMNINHLSLFPDIYGSSLHCNKALEITKY